MDLRKIEKSIEVLRKRHIDRKKWRQDWMPEALAREKKRTSQKDGGPGSGNHGHKGVPGRRGGSAPGNSGSTTKSGSAAAKDHTLGSSCSPAAQKAYDKARKNETTITPAICGIATSIGCEMTGLEHSVKTATSVRDKLERKKQEAEERGETFSDSDTVAGMGDLVRYTMKCSHDSMAESARSAIAEFEKQGFKVTKIDNKWTDESSDYKGLHLDLVSPNGQKCEFQIHSAESLEVKEKLHPLYEEWRKVDTPQDRKDELAKQMKAISKTLTMPKGIEEIKNT